MILRSIGYKAVNVTHVTDALNFDDFRGFVPNRQGRVFKRGVKATDVSKNTADEDDKRFDELFEHGLYASGWLATGPIGVLLTTMNNSFLVGTTICRDFEKGIIGSSSKNGLDLDKLPQAVTWKQWQRINETEIELGRTNGKPREKILNLDRMLEVSKSGA